MWKALSILALVLLAGTFLLLRVSSEAPTESPLDLTIAPVTMDDPESEGELVAVVDLETRDQVATVPSPEPLDLPENTEAAAPHETWMLRLRVEAPSRSGKTPEPADVRIRARLDGDPFAMGDGISASCAIGEVTSIDIGSFRSGTQEPAMLSVTATHPQFGCEPMTVELIAAHVTPGESRAPVEATLRLTPVFAVYGKVVIDPKGGGSMGDEGTRVGVWKSRGGQPLSGGPMSSEWTNGAGEYRLRVPATGQYFVAAVRASSSADGQICDVTNAVPNVELRDLVLRAGESISGQFVAGKSAPDHLVRYSVDRQIDGPTLDFGEHLRPHGSVTLVWSQGRLVRSEGVGTTQDDGSFVAGGLEPGTFRLRVLEMEDARFRSEPRFWEVQAPSSNLRFDLGISTVAVRLVGPPQRVPPKEARLFLTRPEGNELGGDEEEFRWEDGVFSTGHDRAIFYLTPNAPVRFRLAVEGSDDVIREIVSPSSGESTEVAMDLPAGEAIAFGSLTIELSGAVPEEGTSFVVHANPMEGDRPPPTFRLTSDDHAHVLELVDNKLLIPELPVGLTRLAVYPATWVGHRASHHLDSIADVMIEEDLETTLLLKLVLGGRLRISKPDGEGAYANDTCTIRQPGGDPLTIEFIAYAADGGGAWGSAQTLLSVAPSLVMPNLAPGTYEVQVGEDTQLVSVRAGEITDVVFE